MAPLSLGTTWSLPGGAPPGAVAESLEMGTGMPLAWLRLERSQVAAVGARLRAARDEALLEVETGELVEILGRVGERFLEEGDPLRIEALEGLPRWSGISPEMARAVVDGMARDWTRSSLLRLVESDFPDPGVLHRFVPGGRPGSRQRALGDPLLVQVVSGSVPGVSATALLRGLLVRSATVVKPGRGDLLLPLLLAAGIGEEHPGVSRALMIHYWPGGDESARGVEQGWLAEADRVVVYGGPEAVEGARRGSREGVPVVAYPHRLSLGMVGRERTGPEGTSLLRDAARALSLFDGRGCVTPQVLFVEEGGEWTGEEWAQRLAVELEGMAHELPPGKLSPGEAAAIQQIRGAAEMREAAGLGDRLWRGEGTGWTVILDRGSGLRGSCPGRVVRVVPVQDLEEVPGLLAAVGPLLQTVALEVEDERKAGLSEALARAGVSRMTTLAAMPWPPPWWHHDGVPPLGALVRWSDLEGDPGRPPPG
jgi:hypothetical protein